MKTKVLLLCIGISAQLAAQNKPAKDSVNYQSCTCQKIEEANAAPRYCPALADMSKYTMFTKLIPWKLVGGKDAFDNLFCKGYISNGNADGSSRWKSFTLTARNPILLNHPQDSIGINLTPCHAQFYDFDVNAFLKYPVSRYVRNYDFEKEFDNYAQSYVDILYASASLRDEELSKIIFDSKNEGETKTIIAQINKKYKTDVAYDEDEKYVEYIPVVLREKKVPFEQFITDMFIKTDEKVRPINEIEKKRINDIFNPYVNSIFYTDAINTVKELITPTVSLSSQANYVSFIIDSKMLHKPTDKTAAIEILTHISRFNFDTKEGLTLEIKEICLPQSEIAETGVEIAYIGGNVKFINSSRLIIANGASISIPSKKINAGVENLQLNNNIISGDITKNTDEISSYLKSKGFKINLNNQKIHFEKTIK